MAGAAGKKHVSLYMYAPFRTVHAAVAAGKGAPSTRARAAAMEAATEWPAASPAKSATSEEARPRRARPEFIPSALQRMRALTPCGCHEPVACRLTFN
eukprot:5475313-Prymnesium_polylepis.2